MPEQRLEENRLIEMNQQREVMGTVQGRDDNRKKKQHVGGIKSQVDSECPARLPGL